MVHLICTTEVFLHNTIHNGEQIQMDTLPNSCPSSLSCHSFQNPPSSPLFPCPPSSSPLSPSFPLPLSSSPPLPFSQLFLLSSLPFSLTVLVFCDPSPLLPYRPLLLLFFITVASFLQLGEEGIHTEDLESDIGMKL